tara:strand:+ start:356 stop:1087 length:732 start_codon:yes stop_codon:yes gene_type:complete
MSNEYYTSDSNNPVEGQVTEDVGQDEGATQEKSSSDEWKNQAKYFQSEKDKLYAENQKLTKLAQVGEYIRSNPDLAEKLASHIDGPRAPEVQLSKEEFDPWEAYNDPSSKSYQFREQEEQQKIDERVNAKVSQALEGVKTDAALDRLEGELAKRGLDDKQIESFMLFASENPAKHGIDGAIKMWQAISETGGKNVNPLDNVRRTQQNPVSTGILQGEQPRQTSSEDDMWKGVLSATKVGNKLP